MMEMEFQIHQLQHSNIQYIRNITKLTTEIKLNCLILNHFTIK
jgi:hypothetical protein